jgi:3-oxoacyl-[acyl-carrier-protein] synthase-1
MSANRDGINIGEAAALFIISKQPSPVALLGVGESSDAHHMSAPHPQGTGAIQAMQAALDEAEMTPAEVAYINMHGTATPLNDAMESIAIDRVFGGAVPVSSTKPLVGHTLGAAGATEVGFCWLLLNDENSQGRLPPHIWDGVVDEKIPRLNLVNPGQNMAISSGTAFLSNSFAFGGNNASVIIGRV